MTTTTTELLAEAGWYKDRCIDLEYEFSLLKREGYSLPDEQIKNLLSEFWNIDIQFDDIKGYHSNIKLNIEDALSQVDYDYIHRYELALNKFLWPVGTIHYGAGLIILSHDSIFYLFAEGMFFKIASSFYDFIETVVENKEIYQIN